MVQCPGHLADLTRRCRQRHQFANPVCERDGSEAVPGPLESDLYFNHIRVRIFISIGAPLPYKTATARRWGVFPCDGLLEGRPVTDNPDEVFVDLHPVDHRADIGRSERNISAGDVIAQLSSRAFF